MSKHFFVGMEVQDLVVLYAQDPKTMLSVVEQEVFSSIL